MYVRCLLPVCIHTEANLRGATGITYVQVIVREMPKHDMLLSRQMYPETMPHDNRGGNCR